MSLTNDQIAEIARLHCVRACEDCGRILLDKVMAFDVDSWVDATGWNRRRLMRWLGY